MSYAVQNSSSIYSTYISTIDHLPCDIIRSLWLVQACNILADNAAEQLHNYLKQRSPDSWNVSSTEELVKLARTYSEQRSLIERCNAEGLAEIEALNDILNAHKEELDHSVSNLAAFESGVPSHNKSDQDKLQTQLKEHYAKIPLVSQVEALQEEQLSPNVIIRRVSDQQGKLKIIFKIPRDVKPRKTTNNSKPKSTISYDDGDDEFDDDLMNDTDAIIKSKLKLRSRSQSLEPVLLNRRGRKQIYKSKETNLSKPIRSTRSAGATKSKTYIESSPLNDEGYNEATPEPTYCFCHQPSFGSMIACDNSKCPNGEWFHYKCVGILNKVEALKLTKQKWYCKDSCKLQSEEDERIKKLKGMKRKHKKW